MNPELEPENEPVPQAAAPIGRHTRGTGHVTMREEFLALFRDTTRSSPGASSLASDAASERSAASFPEPSRFLRQFLQQTAPPLEPASSGLPRLDHHLGGGFSCGLHLLLGLPGTGKTSFLESLAWEAVSFKRPVLYYALKSGGLRVWEHLITTLGAILDEPAITGPAIRAHELTPEDTETLRRLDAALQESVLPYVSLLDVTPASTRSLSALIEDIRSRSLEAVGRHGRLPLVAIDDLEHLVALTGSRSPSDLLSRLDDALAAESLAGLLAATPADLSRGAAERRLPVRTVLVLTAVSPSPDDAPDQVELEVRRNMGTGWTGTIPLLLDRRSGLFAEAKVTPRRR